MVFLSSSLSPAHQIPTSLSRDQNKKPQKENKNTSFFFIGKVRKDQKLLRYSKTPRGVSIYILHKAFSLPSPVSLRCQISVVLKLGASSLHRGTLQQQQQLTIRTAAATIRDCWFLLLQPSPMALQLILLLLLLPQLTRRRGTSPELQVR